MLKTKFGTVICINTTCDAYSAVYQNGCRVLQLSWKCLRARCRFFKLLLDPRDTG